VNFSSTPLQTDLAVSFLSFPILLFPIFFHFFFYNYQHTPFLCAETLFSPQRSLFSHSSTWQTLGTHAVQENRWVVAYWLIQPAGNIIFTPLFLPGYLNGPSHSVVIFLMLVSRLNCQSCHCSYIGNVNRITKCTTPPPSVAVQLGSEIPPCYQQKMSLLQTDSVDQLLDYNHLPGGPKDLHFTPRYACLFA